MIQGGDAEAAARAMHAAVREIFDTDLIQSVRGGERPGTRSPELVALVLTIPTAIIATADLIARARLGERWRRLIARAEKEEKATGARLLIDPGDGKPIPLHQANGDKIREALAALERQHKNS